MGFVVRDTGQRDQLCTLTGFLKLRDVCLGWAEWDDLVITGMDGQDWEAPLRDGCRRTARHGNHRAEIIRLLLRNVPGTGATHAEAGNGNLFRVDAVAAADVIEQLLHRAFVFRSAPVRKESGATMMAPSSSKAGRTRMLSTLLPAPAASPPPTPKCKARMSGTGLDGE